MWLRRHGPGTGMLAAVRGVPRVATLLMAVVPLLMLAPSPVEPHDAQPRDFVGAQFADGLPTTPTSFEHQSKLWFHDDAWWAVMVEPTRLTLRIFELRSDHTWRPTRAEIAVDPADTGDALSEGDDLYVLTRRADEVLQFMRLQYDPVAREYNPMTPPVQVTDRGVRAPASIAKDGTGRMWATFATAREVLVSVSDSAGETWADPFPVPVPGAVLLSGREVSAVVAFDDSIGIMWSDQADGAFRFAVHRDDAPVTEWVEELALPGPGLVDNHISIKVVPDEAGDRIVAAVKTSQGDRGEGPDSPLILVLGRSSDGTWSRTAAGTLGERFNSPILQVDKTARVLYLLAEAGGTIYVKQAPLDAIAFEPGRGLPFIRPQTSVLADVSGSKHDVTAGSGLVALSGVLVGRTYHHGELALPGEPPPADRPDTEPPTAPGDLRAAADPSGAVGIHWSPSHDGDRWTPGGPDQTPVTGYAISRDGVELRTVTPPMTSFADRPPASDRTYDYTVHAIDRAGNRSPVSLVSVFVPADRATPIWFAWAGALGIGALAAGVIVVRRRRLNG